MHLGDYKGVTYVTWGYWKQEDQVRNRLVTETIIITKGGLYLSHSQGMQVGSLANPIRMGVRIITIVLPKVFFKVRDLT